MLSVSTFIEITWKIIEINDMTDIPSKYRVFMDSFKTKL